MKLEIAYDSNVSFEIALKQFRDKNRISNEIYIDLDKIRKLRNIIVHEISREYIVQPF